MDRIDTQLIDVFVSYCRADSVRVESWAKRMKKGGIEVWFDAAKENGPTARQVPASLAAEGCEVLIWFASKANRVTDEVGHVAALASRKGKAVIIVCLDTSPAPPVFDVSLPGVTVIELLTTGRQGTWEAMLAGIRARGIPWIPPTAKRKRSKEPNVRKSMTNARLWLRGAIAVLGCLVVGSLIVSQLHHKPVELVAQPSASPSSDEPKRLLSVKEDRGQPAPAGQPITLQAVNQSLAGSNTLAVPNLSSGPREPQTMSNPSRPLPPVGTQQDLADPQTRKAIEHVTAAIEATAREKGFSEEQISNAVRFYADPTTIEGKGLQDAAAFRATTIARQQEYPWWKETIYRIKALSTEQPAVMEVIVQSTYEGHNFAEDRHTNGPVLMHYLVDLHVLEQPKIIKMWQDSTKAGR